MKGISTILAMILIVIIVVALIGMTYTFAVGLFSTTTNATNQQTGQVTSNMGKTVAIVAAACKITGSNASYSFTLRDSGTSPINATELAAFVDGVRSSKIVFSDLTPGTLDSQRSFGNETASQGTTGAHTLKISTPAGEIEQQVNCA